MSQQGNMKEVSDAIEEVLVLHNVRIEAHQKSLAEEGDFSEVLDQTQKRLDELNASADEMLQKMGMTREQLKEYLANRANFSPQEWEMLEKTKKTCEEIRQQSQQIIESRIPEDLRETAAKQPTEKKKKKKSTGTKKKWVRI